MHLLLAKNIGSGLGSCLLEADPSDLSRTLLQPVTFWPPGYSLLLLPFTWLLPDSVWVIALSDGLGILIFYRILYLLVVKIFPSNNRLLLYFLFAFVTFGYTPLGTSFGLGTNLWALNFFLAGGYALILQVQKKERHFPGLLVPVLAFLSFFMRYAYLPAALVLAGLGLVQSFRNGKRKQLVLQIILLLVFGGSFLFYQQTTGRSLNYISAYHTKVEQTWYPENLSRTTAIFTNAFLFPVTYGSTNWFSGLGQFVAAQDVLTVKQTALGWIKFFLTAAFCALVLKMLVRFYRKGNRGIRFVVLVLLAIFWAHAALPFYLSLRYPPELFRGVDGVHPWTYVEEVRYFNLSGLLLLGLTLVSFLWEDKRWTKPVLILLLIWNVRSFSLVHSNMGPYPLQNVERQNFWVLKTISSSLIPANAVFYEKPLKERPSNYHYVSVIMADHGVPVLKYREPEQLKTTRTVNLIVAVDHVEYQEGDRQMLELAMANGGRKIGTLDGGYADLYQIVFKPGQTLTLPVP